MNLPVQWKLTSSSSVLYQFGECCSRSDDLNCQANELWPDVGRYGISLFGRLQLIARLTNYDQVLVSAGLALSAYDTYHDYGPHAHASYIQVHLSLGNKASWDTRDVNFSYRHSLLRCSRANQSFPGLRRRSSGGMCQCESIT